MYSIDIKTATTADVESLAQLMVELWPECVLEEEIANNLQMLKSRKDMVYLACNEKTAIGFIHVSLRFDHVEGTSTYPVGYIEGIYIRAPYRQMGIGSKLLQFGEQWAARKGAVEMGSDTEIHNVESQDFHQKNGFFENNRIICFSKKIKRVPD